MSSGPATLSRRKTSTSIHAVSRSAIATSSAGASIRLGARFTERN
jgi:hypothetical protein